MEILNIIIIFAPNMTSHASYKNSAPGEVFEFFINVERKGFSMEREIHTQEPTEAYEHKGLNQAQLHILKMLSIIKTDEALMDLKRLLRNYYAQQLQKEADKYWEEGIIGDQLLNEHLRTPYKCV